MSKRIIRSIAVVLFISLLVTSKKQTMAEEIQMDTVQPEIIQQEMVVVPEDTIEDVTAAEGQLNAQSAEELAAIHLQQMTEQVAVEQAERQLVIIGDSRTVGMKSAVGKNNNIWSAKVGMGLSWMKNTGVPAVEASIGANSDVVILMGVNDVRSLSYTKKYISYLNKKAAAWTSLGANVYYVSVNPMVFETKSYPGITNSLIESWNTRMQQGLSTDITYLDTYSQVNGKLSSKDGIHYNNKSYKLIYNLVNQEIINDKTAKAIAAEQVLAENAAQPVTATEPAISPEQLQPVAADMTQLDTQYQY